MRGYRSGGDRHRNPWFIVMGLQLVQKIVNLPRKPPLTIALMAGMTALHLAPEILADILGAGSTGGGSGRFFTEIYRYWKPSGYGSHIQELCLLPASMLAEFQRWVNLKVLCIP